MGITEFIFALSLVATFALALKGRLAARQDTHDPDLAGRNLNKWLVGLSAAATGNSGYIVTGAVGLGYVSGIYGVLFPLGWLLGDMLFWFLVPARMNRFGRESDATTLSELLGHGLSGNMARGLRILVAIILAVFLATYTSAQWLAGQKFLATAFDFSEHGSFLLFSLTIVAYSTLGGFRGSVYVDTMQAVISLFCSALALVLVILFALGDAAAFQSNMASVPADFFSLVPSGQLPIALGVLFGFAGTAFGFSLSQPQVITRYFAASSPEETRAARWIYIGFIQFTWITMTLFGTVLRGVMPELDDPEAGLIAFFKEFAHPVAAGLIFAYIYAIIGSTANSIIVVMSQITQRDLFSGGAHIAKDKRTPFWLTGMIGAITIYLSYVSVGTVFAIATGAFTKLAAAIAGPVLIKLFQWQHNAVSLLVSIVAGLGTAYLWDFAGLSGMLNVAGMAIAVSIVANWLSMRFAWCRELSEMRA